MDRQLDMFDPPEDHIATWSPRDLWLALSAENVSSLAEDRRVERKAGAKIRQTDELAEYMSMWSNTVDGGLLLLGIADNGEIQGLSSLPQSDLNLYESFHTTKCPEAMPDHKRIPVKINGKPDFVIASFIPYRGVLVSTNRDQSFIRRGDKKHKMSAEERDDFRSTRHERTWEQRPSPLNFPSEFNKDILKTICDNFRSLESKDSWSDIEVLKDRNLLLDHEGTVRATNALALVAGANPRSFYPSCRVRIQRFRGIAEQQGDQWRPIRDVYAEGSIPSIISKASEIIDSLNYDVTWLGRDGKFQTTNEYPKWAWFEALVNALVHRSYSYSGSEITVKFFSDRLEFESPGGFVPPVNEGNVYSQRSSRNPNMMDALRLVGFVKMTREGTRRMRESMEQWELPAPVFSQESINGVSVRVTLRNDHEKRERATSRDVASYIGVDAWKYLTETEIKILGFAFRNPRVQVAEISRLTGRTWNTSKKDLDRLVNKGHMIFNPPKYDRDPNAHYVISGNRWEEFI